MKYNTEIFNKILMDLSGGQFELVGEYSTHEEMEIKCNVCNETFYRNRRATLRNSTTLKGKTCPICSKKNGDLRGRGIDMEEAEKRIDTTKFKIIELNGRDKDSKFIHIPCGKEITRMLRSVSTYGDQACYHCCNEINKAPRHLIPELTIKKCSERLGSEYEVLDINENKNLYILHKPCFTFYKTPKSSITSARFFVGKQGKCPFCFAIPPKERTYSQVVDECSKKLGDNYEVLTTPFDEYLKEAVIKHKTCDYIFSTHPNAIMNRGTRCPSCSGDRRSKGERTINKYLKENGYKFRREARLKECAFKRPLKFDFQIFIDDSKFVFVEYDGKQHEKNIVGFLLMVTLLKETI